MFTLGIISGLNFKLQSLSRYKKQASLKSQVLLLIY